VRTVVVTGGGKGIGASVTEAFCAADSFVYYGSRTDSGLASRLSNRAQFVPCDVRNPQDLHALAERAVQETGAVDVWINNAGYSRWRPVADIDEAFWDNLLDTNLKGVLFGCQAAAKFMTPGSSIINMSSLASKRGTLNNSAYCASKFGVNGITQSLAKELGPYGIRVNAICPVLIGTDGLNEALQEESAPGNAGVDEFLLHFALSQTALGRLPTAADVAAVSLFLASDAASAMTGQCINVDCGVLPQ
jgi:3-oxoacyl-[acyl-carrier protein] reductase/meso-butanediol dehydrogenase/(S,S)-butanediol dehydrogenase/diacetyl reductase